MQKAIHAVAHLKGALRRPDASSPSSRVAPSPQAELQSFSPSVGAAAEAADSALRAAVDLRACLRAVARALKKHPFSNRSTETPRPGEKTDYSVKFLDNWLQQRRDYVCARGERPPGPKLVLLARLTSRGKSVVTTAPVVVPANRPWLTMSAGETLEGYEPVPVSGGAHQSLPFAMLSKLKPRSVCHATGDVMYSGAANVEVHELENVRLCDERDADEQAPATLIITATFPHGVRYLLAGGVRAGTADDPLITAADTEARDVLAILDSENLLSRDVALNVLLELRRSRSDNRSFGPLQSLAVSMPFTGAMKKVKPEQSWTEVFKGRKLNRITSLYDRDCHRFIEIQTLQQSTSSFKNSLPALFRSDIMLRPPGVTFSAAVPVTAAPVHIDMGGSETPPAAGQPPAGAVDRSWKQCVLLHSTTLIAAREIQAAGILCTTTHDRNPANDKVTGNSAVWTKAHPAGQEQSKVLCCRHGDSHVQIEPKHLLSTVPGSTWCLFRAPAFVQPWGLGRIYNLLLMREHDPRVAVFSLLPLCSTDPVGFRIAVDVFQYYVSEDSDHVHVAILVDGGLILQPYNSVQRMLRLFRFTSASDPGFTPPVGPRSFKTQERALLSDTPETKTLCAPEMEHEPTVSTVVLRVRTASLVSVASSSPAHATKRRKADDQHSRGDLDQLRAMLYSRGLAEDELIRAFAWLVSYIDRVAGILIPATGRNCRQA